VFVIVVLEENEKRKEKKRNETQAVKGNPVLISLLVPGSMAGNKCRGN
jgi:hypothetical protein